jgi:SnoaL-like domain
MTSTTTTIPTTAPSVAPTIDTIIDTYMDAYSEPDVARRAELVAKTFTSDGELIDPPIDGKGHAGITEMMGAVLSHYPDHRFRRTTGIDAHHNVARYGWELVDTTGAVALTGTDVAEFDDGGAISRVLGFLGDLAPREG